MATLIRSITIITFQAFHIFFRTQHTCNDNFMKWDVLYGKRIKEPATYMLEQHTGTRYQIWNTPIHLGIYFIIGISTYEK